MTDNGYILSERDASDFADMRADFYRDTTPQGGAVQPAHVWQPDRLTPIKVQVTSAIEVEGGRYKGKLLGLGVATAPQGDLATTDYGDIPAGEGVILWNAAETGTNGHTLPVDGSCITTGIIISFSTDNATLDWPIVMAHIGPGGSGTDWTLEVDYWSNPDSTLHSGKPIDQIIFGKDAPSTNVVGQVNCDLCVIAGTVATIVQRVWTLVIVEPYMGGPGGTDHGQITRIQFDNTGGNSGDPDTHAKAVKITPTFAADGAADWTHGNAVTLKAELANPGDLMLTMHWDEAGPGAEDGAQDPTDTLYIRDTVNGEDANGKFIAVTFPVTKDANNEKVTVEARSRAGLNDLTDVDLDAEPFTPANSPFTVLAEDPNTDKWEKCHAALLPSPASAGLVLQSTAANVWTIKELTLVE